MRIAQFMCARCVCDQQFSRDVVAIAVLFTTHLYTQTWKSVSTISIISIEFVTFEHLFVPAGVCRHTQPYYFPRYFCFVSLQFQGIPCSFASNTRPRIFRPTIARHIHVNIKSRYCGSIFHLKRRRRQNQKIYLKEMILHQTAHNSNLINSSVWFGFFFGVFFCSVR